MSAETAFLRSPSSWRSSTRYVGVVPPQPPDWPLDESDYAAMRDADQALAEGRRDEFVSLSEVKRRLAADEAAEPS